MPRNGSGVYTSAKNWTAGETLTETDLDAFVADLESALTASLAKDGQTVPTADLPMGNFRHTNCANGNGRTTYSTVRQVQDASIVYAGSAGGTATAITATLAPAITAYATPQWVIVKATADSGAGATININGAGAGTIKRHSRDIRAGDWLNGDLLVIAYDGTNFQLIAPNRVVFRGARATRASSQAITTATATAVTFGAEDFDTDTLHDTGSNTDRLTVGATGYWSLTAFVQWESNNTGAQRYAAIIKNDTTSYAVDRSAPTGTSEVTLTTGAIAVTAADYFKLVVYHDKGSDLNVEVASLSATILQ